MAFDAAAVAALYDQLVSHAEKLGTFDAGVNPEEPWSAPNQGVWCAFAAPAIAPTGAASGLAAVSGRLEFKAVIGTSANVRPAGRADKTILAAAAGLLAEYSGAFSLGGTVRNVDLLGAHGTPLSGQPAFMSIGEHTFRVYEITLPVIVNDLWNEVA